MWLYIVAGCSTVVVLYSLKKYLTGGKCLCKSQLDGKVVIITGSNSGIGKATAFELARRGAVVILACRDLEKGDITAKEIITSTGNTNVYIEILDLTSFESILNFSQRIYKSYNEVYALINNAGVFCIPHSITNDGFEETFQANYLGPFLLTSSLLPLLKNSKHARIVNVSSSTHSFPKHLSLDLEEINGLKNVQSYGYSKFCLNLFTHQLAKNLKDYNVSVNCLDPGLVGTNIFRHCPLLSNSFVLALIKPFSLIFVKSPEDGAQGVIHAVLSPFLEKKSGFYFSHMSEGRESKLCQREDLALMLWEKSCEWTKLKL